MHIQRIQSFTNYNNRLQYQNNRNNNVRSQVSFGVGEDYGIEDDAFNQMNKRAESRNNNRRLQEDDDRTLLEVIFGEKKSKHPLNPKDPRILSLEEDPSDIADDLADEVDKDK